MENEIAVPEEVITSKIYILRGRKVILDVDLADLYEVEVKYLKRQVKRNIIRFPADFMFELTRDEYHEFLRCQIGTLDVERGKFSKYLPYAFTEQGVAMLSGILSSEIAIKMNISIMRAFVQLRNLIDSNRELAEKISNLESRFAEKSGKHDQEIEMLFDAIHSLMTHPEPPRKKIGFKAEPD